MQIIDLIPATKIPRNLAQIYTYHTRHRLKIGSLVLAPLAKRKIKAIVIKIRDFNKLEIKNYDYQLRPIIKIIQKEPILDKNLFELAAWISDYYYEPISLVIKIIIQNTKYKILNTKSQIIKPEKGMYEKVFAFCANKMIIQDEHSPLYKSQRAPRINLRDAAVKLAEIKKNKFELRSDTPSLESYYKYNLKPKIKNIRRQIIDMRGKKSIISDVLLQELKKSKSSLLFLNRLGAATLILCQDCGYIAKCENCDGPMVYHLFENQLICHHCGFKSKALLTCPKCNSWQIKYLGAGVEKIKQEIAKLKLSNKILIMTLKQRLPRVDLIGVISADTILHLPDFRSPERTFQALVKLNNLCKKIIIQTYTPEHYIFDFDNFYQKELKIRKELNYPPFCQLIKLTYRHKNLLKAKTEAFRVSKILNTKYQIPILGPAPAFIAKKRGLYYWNIIIKNLKLKIKNLDMVPTDWIVDVDPVSLL